MTEKVTDGRIVFPPPEYLIGHSNVYKKMSIGDMADDMNSSLTGCYDKEFHDIMKIGVEMGEDYKVCLF
jgi:hypothetical protein